MIKERIERKNRRDSSELCGGQKSKESRLMVFPNASVRSLYLRGPTSLNAL